MATTRTISTFAGLAATLVLLVAAPALATRKQAHVAPVVVATPTNLAERLAGSTSASVPRSGRAISDGYGWPVKPFRVQHPVRGFFGDPRIGMTREGMRSTFHFGVDVSAPDGAPVYATLSGSARRWSFRPEVVGVVGDDGHTSFEYWHIRPAVSAGQRVSAYRTIVGYVEVGWGHVHFSELRDGVYLNPLRPGAMGPYADSTRPIVKSLRAERRGDGVKPTRLSGRVDLVAETFDETPLAVPAPWANRPVTPALLRWRVRGRPWRIAVDFRRGIPSDDRYTAVYAAWTRQNKPWSNGRYRFYLVHGWNTTGLADGAYRIDVAATDTRGNTSTTSFAVRVRNEPPGA